MPVDDEQEDNETEADALLGAAYLTDDAMLYAFGIGIANWQASCYDDQEEGDAAGVYGDALSRKHSNDSNSSSISSVSSSTAIAAGLSGGLRRRQTGSNCKPGK